MKKYCFTIIYFIAALSSTLCAHHSTEITYQLEQKENQYLLTIHCTPQTIMDLLEYKQPKLKQQSILNLQHHLAIYTDYFNQTFRLKTKGKRATFTLVNYDLQQHDAHLTFQINDVAGDLEAFKLKVNCFTEIYQQPLNHILLINEGGQKDYFLNRDHRFLHHQTHQNMEVTNIWKRPFLRYGLLGLLTLVLLRLVLFSNRVYN
ncbi:MAG: DUF6702 family protein [Bacteroidota bacterium]